MPESRPGRWWQIGSLVATALLFAIGVESPFAFAQPVPCSTTITDCGCVILSPGQYTLGNPLVSSSPGEDCIDVDSPGVELDLAGFSITGPLANPPPTPPAPPEVTAVGINFERKASRAILNGGGATVSGFNQGVVIIGYEATANDFSTTANEVGFVLFGTRDSRVSNFDASGNGENGIMIESGSHNQLTGFAANSNGGDGVLLFDSAHSQLSGFTANSNAGQGVNVGVVAMHNQLTAFAANSNTGDGVFLSDKADSNEISGFITDSNGLSGVDIMRFIGIVSCAGPKRIPCNAPSKRNLVENGDAEDNSVYGIEVVNTRTEEIIGNTATSNGTDDLFDSNTRCDGDKWQRNTFGTANQPCIH